MLVFEPNLGYCLVKSIVPRVRGHGGTNWNQKREKENEKEKDTAELSPVGRGFAQW